MSRTDLDAATLAAHLRGIVGDGSVEWCYTPIQASVLLDMADMLDENAKLRELCRRYSEYVSQDRCEGCVYKTRCNNGLIDECWQRGEVCNLARELGIEGKETKDGLEA